VRERINFFVNVSPEIAILDVPFLVIVWDLRHRLQPFFPEVGSATNGNAGRISFPKF
jgi:hypothetical protein